MLAASRPDIELVAISCVAGRVNVLHACENALRVLKACGRDDVSFELKMKARGYLPFIPQFLS